MQPTLMYIKLSMLTPRSSGTWVRHLPRKEAIESPFLHWAAQHGYTKAALTSTTLRCPLPSQYE